MQGKEEVKWRPDKVRRGEETCPESWGQDVCCTSAPWCQTSLGHLGPALTYRVTKVNKVAPRGPMPTCCSCKVVDPGPGPE